MTEQEITALGPAFAAYLRRFRDSFGQDRTAAHFDTYCRGLLSDLPRKSVEPIALEAGTAVRTLQEFLATAKWDHATARDVLQQHLGAVLADSPADALGTVGVIDETSCRKWGDRTPGVQRQYLGCVGKVEHGIVTVHIEVTRGTVWTAATATVWAAGRDHTPIAAINEATAEVKCFRTDATAEPVARVLAVAFRRATVEHAFRLAKQEAGLTHFEGRDYTGLSRHLILALVVLGFVAVHTERLRGEKPARHGRAGVPG